MLARYLIAAYAILMSMAGTIPAAAQDRPQDYHARFSVACGREINSKCQGVPDQRGQLLACLYGQRHKLSPRCEGVVLGAIHRLATALRKTGNVPQVCDQDIRQTCAHVKHGGGNLVTCFLVAQDTMSPQCKDAIYSVWER
jgi:hypothetical protein